MRNVKPVDLRLNAIVDPDRAGGHDLVGLARRVVEGGATLVQLRDKRSDTRAVIETARAIKAALAPSGVPFVVNDRVDVALAAGADGVHLGQNDLSIHDARKICGRDLLIGASTHDLEEAEAAFVAFVADVEVVEDAAAREVIALDGGAGTGAAEHHCRRVRRDRQRINCRSVHGRLHARSDDWLWIDDLLLFLRAGWI
jgi:hypothetical protein